MLQVHKSNKVEARNPFFLGPALKNQTPRVFLGNPTINKALASRALLCVHTWVDKEQGTVSPASNPKMLSRKDFRGQRRWHAAASHNNLPNPWGPDPARQHPSEA